MIKKMKKALVCGAAGALLPFGATVAAAPEASAVSANGCPWPYVCFYKTAYDWGFDRPTAMYRDMGYRQKLSPGAYGAYAVYNSRNDDCAQLYYYRNWGGWQVTLSPNQAITPGRDGLVFTSIKIVDTCPQ